MIGRQEPRNVLFAGVGGQGVMLASEVLARAAAVAGYDVKKSELHGLAMRGGAVVSHVRFGLKVHAPLIPVGQADVVVALEELEASRQVPMVRGGGCLLVATTRLSPMPILLGKAAYPEPGDALARRADLAFHLIPSVRLATQAGRARSANFVMLGVLSRYLPIEPAAWRSGLVAALPHKPGDVNLRAFALGLHFIEESTGQGNLKDEEGLAVSTSERVYLR